MRLSFLSKGFSAVSIIVILAALAVIGGGVYYLWSESSPATQSSSEAPTAGSSDIEESIETGEFRSTLPRIVGRGESLECDWRMPVENPDSPFSTGKLWTTGNQGRSAISGSINGASMEANAIYKDNAAYSWMEFSGVKMGFKFSQSEIDSMNNAMTAEQKQQAEQIRQEMIFSCKPWTPDASKFTLPTDVEFKEM
jgi:hypothetical protein